MFAVGLILVVVAVLLVLAEAHLSTGGLIASAAVIALITGVGLLLADARAGVVGGLAVVGVVGFASVAGLTLLVRSLRWTRGMRPRAGVEAMIGHVGVLRRGGSALRVFVDGGLWRAQPSPLEEAHALHDGDCVVVERVNGLTLSVRKAEEWECNP